MKNSSIPDHADRRKASADAKRALIERAKAGKKSATTPPADTEPKSSR